MLFSLFTNHAPRTRTVTPAEMASGALPRAGHPQHERTEAPPVGAPASATVTTRSAAPTSSADSDGDRQHSVPESFEQLYDQYYPFVRRTVRRFGVADAALEDLCQEVFIVIHRRWAEFEGRSKLTTWVYRIVANSVLNHFRTKRRKPLEPASGSAELAALSSAAMDPEDSLAQKRAAAVAREIVMAMPEARRMAFVLVELEGMSYSEAAEALEESGDTVRARVRAARLEFTRHAQRYLNLTAMGVDHGR